jgi:hypothetical protein
VDVWYVMEWNGMSCLLGQACVFCYIVVYSRGYQEYSRQYLLFNGPTLLAKVYTDRQVLGKGTPAWSRAVQGTAPQLQSWPSYVCTLLGSIVVVACEVFHRSCEAEALLRPLGIFSGLVSK